LGGGLKTGSKADQGRILENKSVPLFCPLFYRKSNTVKKRVHSLFRQGCMLYELIPNMLADRLRPLIERFSEMLNEQRVFKEVFGVL
jgi:hypothetical protein